MMSLIAFHVNIYIIVYTHRQIMPEVVWALKTKAGKYCLGVSRRKLKDLGNSRNQIQT